MPPRTRTNTRQRPGKPATKTVTVPTPMLSAAENTHEIEVLDEDPLAFTTKVDRADNPFAERENVFQVDDTWYTAPVRVPAGWGLQYLRLKSRAGIDAAVVWALEIALGPDALDALASVPDLDSEHLDTIAQRITQKFVDSTSVPKGELRSV
jgi:hypothetical protein